MSPDVQTPGWDRASAEARAGNDAIIDDAAAHGKRIANYRAEFAMAGFELRVIRYPDGRAMYEVSRWDHSRRFSHLHDVQAFLTQVAGKRRHQIGGS